MASPLLLDKSGSLISLLSLHGSSMAFSVTDWLTQSFRILNRVDSTHPPFQFVVYSSAWYNIHNLGDGNWCWCLLLIDPCSVSVSLYSYIFKFRYWYRPKKKKSLK